MRLPLNYSDFYKTDHRRQYPKGTQVVYSNMTARGSRIPEIDHVVVFGIQYFLKEYLTKRFDHEFFLRSRREVVEEYKRRLDTSLGPDAVPVDHMTELHRLGYLPVTIKALPEGTLCPMRVPFMTIYNTHHDFFWVTNFLETLMSSVIWHPMTSATIAFEYRKILQRHAARTAENTDFVQWQGHDFSMRGQSSLESACVSGGAHLLSFTGTDTIPAIDFLEMYYGADSEKELIGGSVSATEHSVMCLGGDESELETYRRLITEVYPKGIVSIVSDTWDYWNVLTSVLPALKDVILSREGKVVIRPDSGDPVKIICGDSDAPIGSPAELGTARILWDLFGGRINSKGYKELDPHIGMIYGDSISLERCREISTRLEAMKFATTNIVYGIGSYTYQYVTRDTFGFAIKATAGIINNREVSIFKDPATDSGVKKSARGWLRVNEDLTLSENVSRVEERQGLLEEVFVDGTVVKQYTLDDIRKRLLKYV